MPSKFFGNRLEKQTRVKKGAKQKFDKKRNKAKSSGIRKLGRAN